MQVSIESNGTSNQCFLVLCHSTSTSPSRAGVRGVRTNHPVARGGLLFWWCLFHGTERNGAERNAGLFHGTDNCDNGTINLILE